MSLARHLHLPTIRVLVRTFGWRGMLRRLTHEVRRKSNSYKNEPAVRRIRNDAPKVFKYTAQPSFRRLNPGQAERISGRGKQVLAGHYQAFGDRWLPLPKSTDDWHRHPRTGYRFPDVVWWKVPHLPPGSDIKDVWEPARFSWAYDLVRAYLVTGDDAFASAFYAHAAAWCNANPPFRGTHWSCGQETAIRALAILHALDSLPGNAAVAATARQLNDVLAWSGERIADAIAYGLSQRNNHGISESAGLVHLGLRFAGLHPAAKRWLNTGIGYLDEQVCDQFSEDGWYAQHSFIYMRVALEQALYAQWVLLAAGLSLSQPALDRLAAATDLLTLLVETESGVLPNHGANDGARVLPLAPSEHRDFRPVLTLAAIVLDRPLGGGVAADPYTSAWFDHVPRIGKTAVPSLSVGSSGWVAARAGDCRAFMFAGRYRHRPSHLDQLHLHLSCGGREIITDAGTYSYNHPPPWNNGLASSLVHNGPVIDGREIAQRGPRFLWLGWPRAKIVTATQSADTIRISAERDGQVRRDILLHEGGARIIDRCIDRSAGQMQVTWLLHPDAADVSNVVARGSQEIHASDMELAGWYSPTYGRRLKSRALRIVQKFDGDIEEGFAPIETSIDLATGNEREQ